MLANEIIMLIWSARVKCAFRGDSEIFWLSTKKEETKGKSV